ncbi:MAG: phage tail sheath family protein [Xenococcus sp. (in: cyanobacteria)]
MPQYLSPGVYVEYEPPVSLPIAGVATSVAGFIGVVDKDVEMPPIPGTVKLDKTYKLELDSLTSTDPLPDNEKSLVYVAKVDDGGDSFYHILIFDEKGNVVINKGKDDFSPDSDFTTAIDAAIDAGNEPDEPTTREIFKKVTASLLSYQVAKAGEPIEITSWEEFKSKFGEFKAGNTGNKILAHAVYGFFFNGGSRCYVLRVATATDIVNPAEELEKFEAVDKITIIAIPGAISQAQHTAIIAHCAKMEDRVAVLDSNSYKKEDPSGVTDIRPVGVSKEASYAAIYYPWIEVFDPVSNASDTIPPSGHIAGIYARNDATRGVYKAPANEVIVNALDVSRPISKAQQDVLNPKGINVIRSFKGTIKVWGARTMADNDNADFRYVSTRRYFNYLRESIDENTQFAVFEPNNLALWQKIKRTVGDFLLNEWRDGALFGETPDKAFFVICDAETNPKQVRELGQVVALIGVAIVKPAEFVIFRIQQTAGE